MKTTTVITTAAISTVGGTWKIAAAITITVALATVSAAAIYMGYGADAGVEAVVEAGVEAVVETVAPDTTNYTELGKGVLSRYVENMDPNNNHPYVLAHTLPGHSIIGTVEQLYGLDGRVGMDMGTYTKLAVDVGVAIEMNGDLQLALNLANYIVDHLQFQGSFFKPFGFQQVSSGVFVELSFLRISESAMEIQELLSNGNFDWQDPELVARIDVLLKKIFIGYASLLDPGQIQHLQECAPTITSKSEVYDFLISRINRCYGPEVGKIFR